jgi:hypothetical protein
MWCTDECWYEVGAEVVAQAARGSRALHWAAQNRKIEATNPERPFDRVGGRAWAIKTSLYEDLGCAGSNEVERLTGGRTQTTERMLEVRKREDKEREWADREREFHDDEHNHEVSQAFSQLRDMGMLHEPQDLVETFTAMREPDYTWGSLHLYRNHILFTSSMLSTQVRERRERASGSRGRAESTPGSPPCEGLGVPGL